MANPQDRKMRVRDEKRVTFERYVHRQVKDNLWSVVKQTCEVVDEVETLRGGKEQTSLEVEEQFLKDTDARREAEEW
jgi:hypothetical protein